MSKSVSTPTTATNGSKTAGRTGKRAPARPHADLEVEPIDYAPAIDAIGDVFTWALDLAHRNVSHWPEGKRKVNNARRHLRAILRGKVPRGRGVEEDVMFTAALLARIFDADLGLGLGPIAMIFEELGFPPELVPSAPRTSKRAPRPPIDPASDPLCDPAIWLHVSAIFEALGPDDALIAGKALMKLSADESAHWYATLSRLSVPSAVALIRSQLAAVAAVREQTRARPMPLRPAVRVTPAAPCGACPVGRSPFHVAG